MDSDRVRWSWTAQFGQTRMILCNSKNWQNPAQWSRNVEFVIKQGIPLDYHDF